MAASGVPRGGAPDCSGAPDICQREDFGPQRKSLARRGFWWQGTGIGAFPPGRYVCGPLSNGFPLVRASLMNRSRVARVFLATLALVAMTAGAGAGRAAGRALSRAVGDAAEV